MAASTSSSNKRLFLIGPGFIGGTLLVRLRETRPDLSLFALTRRQEQANELQQIGVTPVHGGLNDAKVIKEQVAQADIVIHTATADDVPSTQAVVEALRMRDSDDIKKRKVVYIQTSGNDELIKSAQGALSGTSVEQRTLSDAKGDDVLEDGRIQTDAPHRHVDGVLRKQLFNEEAERQFNVSTTIMMPPLIYGTGAEPWRRTSIQAPMLTRAMLQKGLVTLPENSAGVWNAVSVHDLVEAYLVLLKQLEQHTPGTAQPSHYCFPADPQVFKWKELFDVIVERLQHFGGDRLAKEPVKVIKDMQSFEEFIGGKENPYSPLFSQIVFGQENSFTKPDRLNALGFKHNANGPIHSIKSENELDGIIKTELSKLQN